MPKLVNHEQRRELIADAVCRLTARNGLEEVSLRHVAVEAGISVGQLQHYFGTKDDMLLFAFRTLSARVGRRIESAGTGQPPPSTRTLLRVLLMAMVPHDSESQFEAPLWIAFMARAAVEPALALPLREGITELVGFAADRLRAAQETGELDVSLDPDHEAAALFALADGLMLRSLLEPGRTDSAVVIIDYRLDRIFNAG